MFWIALNHICHNTSLEIKFKMNLLPLQPQTRFAFVEFLSHTPLLEHVEGTGVHSPMPVKVFCPFGCMTRPQVVLKRQKNPGQQNLATVGPQIVVLVSENAEQVEFTKDN
jgi:hypothetical protein